MLRRSIGACLVAIGWFFAQTGTVLSGPTPVQIRINQRLKAYSKLSPGLLAVDLQSGQTLASIRPDQALKPASVLKVLTSAIALQELGPEFVFKTLFYVAPAARTGGYNLHIKGGGDPSLNLEAAWKIAQQLARFDFPQGFDGIVVDTTLFSDPIEPRGQRAYQTGASALSFNYNSVGFDICPGPSGSAARVYVVPEGVGVEIQGKVQTVSRGQVGVSVSQRQSAGGLSFTLGGKIRSGSECVRVYRSVPEPEIVFARFLKSLLLKEGHKVGDNIVLGPLPAQARFLYEHSSEPLAAIVRDLNHFSTNFIGEQLVYALGQGGDGFWRHRDGLQRMQQFVASLGVPPEQFELHDGSGLSHANRISTSALVRILKYAWSNPLIRPELESSLSVAEYSGTLRRRTFALGDTILRGKTGTIDGVSSLAGFIYGTSGRVIAFAFIQNQVASKNDANRLEEEIVSILAES